MFRITDGSGVTWTPPESLELPASPATVVLTAATAEVIGVGDEVYCGDVPGAKVIVGPGTVTVVFEVIVVSSVTVFSIDVGVGVAVTVTVGPVMVIVIFCIVVEWTVIVSVLGGGGGIGLALDLVVDVDVEEVWVAVALVFMAVDVEVELVVSDSILVGLCVVLEDDVEVEVGLVIFDVVRVVSCVALGVDVEVFDFVLVALCVVPGKRMYDVVMGAPPPSGTTSTSITLTFSLVDTCEIHVVRVVVDAPFLVPVPALRPERGMTFPLVIRFVGVAEEALAVALDVEQDFIGGMGGEFLSEVGSADAAVLGVDLLGCIGVLETGTVVSEDRVFCA